MFMHEFIAFLYQFLEVDLYQPWSSGKAFLVWVYQRRESHVLQFTMYMYVADERQNRQADGQKCSAWATKDRHESTSHA